MFGKKCPRCNSRIKKDFDFCPHCGTDFRTEKKQEKEKDFGMLGVDDFPVPQMGIKMPFGMNFLVKNLMKEMDNQFKMLDRELGKEKDKEKNKNVVREEGGISINISSDGGTPVIKVKSFGNIPEFNSLNKNISQTSKKEKPIRIKNPEISDAQAIKFSKLPRQEASSRVRRLSGKIIYEIDMPGVSNEKDVIVNQLENSIEVKAFAKDKAYFKFLPVALPILKYGLKNSKLVLELAEK